MKLLPVEPQSIFSMDGWCVWDPSLVRDDGGRFHLFFSRWPIDKGHNAWITHSEVCRAEAESPLGPYRFAETVLPRRPGFWDADNIHNPQVQRFGDRFYLLYNGNHAGGPRLETRGEIQVTNPAWWRQRNHQRVGLAVAERPEGLWRRFDRPLLDVTPGAWDDILTTNPSGCRSPDGPFVLLYKAVGSRNPPPRFGPVYHGAAFAEHPEGPYTKHPNPLFTREDIDFPGEDPFIWHQDGRFHVILKDMGTAYSDTERALVRFASKNAIDWSPAEEPVFCERMLHHADGRREPVHRLERPFLHLENGQPRTFFAAVKPREDGDHSFIVAMETANS